MFKLWFKHHLQVGPIIARAGFEDRIPAECLDQDEGMTSAPFGNESLLPPGVQFFSIAAARRLAYAILRNRRGMARLTEDLKADHRNAPGWRVPAETASVEEPVQFAFWRLASAYNRLLQQRFRIPAMSTVDMHLLRCLGAYRYITTAHQAIPWYPKGEELTSYGWRENGSAVPGGDSCYREQMLWDPAAFNSMAKYAPHVDRPQSSWNVLPERSRRRQEKKEQRAARKREEETARRRNEEEEKKKRKRREKKRTAKKDAAGGPPGKRAASEDGNPYQRAFVTSHHRRRQSRDANSAQ